MSYLFVIKNSSLLLQANSTDADILDHDQVDLKLEDTEEGQEMISGLEPIVEVLASQRIKRGAAAPDILGALGAGKSGKKELAK